MIQLYKVLTPKGTGGYSEFVWPLPQNGKPGEWVEVSGPLEMCQNGLHATTKPANWWKPGARIYPFEFEGEILTKEGDKCCCRKARLHPELTIEHPVIILSSELRCLVLIGMFQRKEIEQINLRGADLRGAYLGDADLRDADLRGAYLGDADLRDADLRDADLRGADLRDADLRGANLGGAYLRGANLGDAYRPEGGVPGYSVGENGRLVKC